MGLLSQRRVGLGCGDPDHPAADGSSLEGLLRRRVHCRVCAKVSSWRPPPVRPWRFPRLPLLLLPPQSWSEDSEVVRTLAARILTDDGYQVVTAGRARLPNRFSL